MRSKPGIVKVGLIVRYTSHWGSDTNQSAIWYLYAHECAVVHIVGQYLRSLPDRPRSIGSFGCFSRDIHVYSVASILDIKPGPSRIFDTRGPGNKRVKSFAVA